MVGRERGIQVADRTAVADWWYCQWSRRGIYGGGMRLLGR